MPGAQFQHYDLGQVVRGSTVVITLSGNSANVRLLDSANFNSYRQGRQHRYHGGQAKQSPVRIGVPSSGHWHVVVDLMGLGGTVRSSARVEPPPPDPLPLIRPSSPPARPLSRIVENVAAVAPESSALPKAYDVFISHASEDKDDFVRALAEALRNKGLIVWYDEFEIRIGDNVRRRIDVGLVSSRFGVVVLSPAFLAKPWAQYELDGLVTREMSGEQQIILPIWHGLTRDQLVAVSPSLANTVALRTEDLSIDQIADQIAEVISGRSS
jgi:hypothetical protein